MNHYFSPSPDSNHAFKTIEWTCQGRSFSFTTDQSVFSKNRVDYGTQRLIQAFLDSSDRKNGRLLDLGCGYGVVGIVVKRTHPALTVVMCDINERAVSLAKENAKRNHVSYAEIIQSDGMANVSGSFDIILTNPPVRAGKETVYRFFEQAAQGLSPDGALYVVLRKQQGALSAQKKLSSLFQTVQVVDRSAGYHVMRAAVRKQHPALADPVCL